MFWGDGTRFSVGGVGKAPIIVKGSGRQLFRPGDTAHLRVAAEAFLSL